MAVLYTLSGNSDPQLEAVMGEVLEVDLSVAENAKDEGQSFILETSHAPQP